MRVLNFLLATLILIYPVFVLHAASKQAPIQIEADSVELDEKNGTSTYLGNVKLSQNGMSIQADKVSVFTNEFKLSKIVAVGKPAIFTQEPNDKTEGVIAKAASIEYDANLQSLLLTENVQLEQGENRFTGEIVQYDIQKNIMKASGNETNRRVQATILLDQVQQ